MSGTPSPKGLPPKGCGRWHKTKDGERELVTVDALPSPAEVLEAKDAPPSTVEDFAEVRKDPASLLNYVALRSFMSNEPTAYEIQVAFKRFQCWLMLLGVEPLASMSLSDLAKVNGCTKAALSKILLTLADETGLRCGQMRSRTARKAYARRARSVHAERKKKPDAPEGTPGETSWNNQETSNRKASYHE